MKYESSGDRNKNISVKEYLNKIKRYLREIIINLQKSDAWKIQLTIVINFISSKKLLMKSVQCTQTATIKNFCPMIKK